MNNNYARHKRFINDVSRAVDIDLISNIVSYYLPLRASTVMQNLPDEKILNCVQMITKTDLSDIYKTLYNDGLGLSNHEIVFRIKRIKYIKTKNDTLTYSLTEPIKELGRNIGTTFINHLDIENLKVIKTTENEEKVEKRQRVDKEKVLNFALENVNWKGRDGHVNKGTMGAPEAVKELAKQGIKISALRIRGILREYYQDKPLPEKPAEESKEE